MCAAVASDQTTQARLLKCSLSEALHLVRSLENPCSQQNNPLTSSVLNPASLFLNPQTRPYLNFKQRQSLKLLPNSFLEKFFPGQNLEELCLHASFNCLESSLALQALNYITPQNFNSIGAQWESLASEAFPGRLGISLQNYWFDYLSNHLETEFGYYYWNNNSIVIKPSDCQIENTLSYSSSLPKLPRRLRGFSANIFLEKELGNSYPHLGTLICSSSYIRNNNSEAYLPSSSKRSFYKALVDFNYSSGPINVSKFYQKNSNFYFVIGACALEQYNRPGELIVCHVNQARVKCLDGHFSRLQNGAISHQTVTDIQIKEQEGLCFSCSYDQSIKVWSIENGNLLSTWKSHKNSVNSLALHSQRNLLASCSSDGSVLLWNYNFKENYEASPTKLVKKPAREEKNNIYSVYFCPIKYPDFVCSAIGVDESGKKGSVEIHDSAALKKLGAISNFKGGISCISINKGGDLLAVGGNRILQSDTWGGKLCLYNLSQISNKMGPVQTFETKHLDTDSVFFSPDPQGILVASCETSNNEILVFDRRFPACPLHTLNNTSSNASTTSPNEGGIIGTAWTTTNQLLLTGGIDCCVKIWDLSLGQPLIAGLSGCDGPISSISISDDDTTFMAGTDTGKVFIYTFDEVLRTKVTHGIFDTW